MRIQVLFFILFSLLCLSRAADLAGSLSEYRVVASLESLFRLPHPKPQPGDEQQMATLQEQKRQHFGAASAYGIELLLLAGIGYCFVRVWKRSKPDHAA